MHLCLVRGRQNSKAALTIARLEAHQVLQDDQFARLPFPRRAPRMNCSTESTHQRRMLKKKQMQEKIIHQVARRHFLADLPGWG